MGKERNGQKEINLEYHPKSKNTFPFNQTQALRAYNHFLETWSIG